MYTYTYSGDSSYTVCKTIFDTNNNIVAAYKFISTDVIHGKWIILGFQAVKKCCEFFMSQGCMHVKMIYTITILINVYTQ